MSQPGFTAVVPLYMLYINHPHVVLSSFLADTKHASQRKSILVLERDGMFIIASFTSLVCFSFRPRTHHGAQYQPVPSRLTCCRFLSGRSPPSLSALLTPSPPYLGEMTGNSLILSLVQMMLFWSNAQCNLQLGYSLADPLS